MCAPISKRSLLKAQEIMSTQDWMRFLVLGPGSEL